MSTGAAEGRGIADSIEQLPFSSQSGLGPPLLQLGSQFLLLRLDL